MLSLSLSYYKSLVCPVKQVFSTLEVLGWYTNGTLPVEDDAKFHEQVIWLQLGPVTYILTRFALSLKATYWLNSAQQ